MVVVASMPCYQEQNVDAQRGRGVIRTALPASGPERGQVRGPAGACSILCATQMLRFCRLRSLRSGRTTSEPRTTTGLFSISCTRLQHAHLTVCAPAGEGSVRGLHAAAADSYSKRISTTSCAGTSSVDYEGYVYGDFNQMLSMPLVASDRQQTHISTMAESVGERIAVGEHCRCTAGRQLWWRADEAQTAAG